MPSALIMSQISPMLRGIASLALDILKPPLLCGIAEYIGTDVDSKANMKAELPYAARRRTMSLHIHCYIVLLTTSHSQFFLPDVLLAQLMIEFAQPSSTSTQSLCHCQARG